MYIFLFAFLKNLSIDVFSFMQSSHNIKHHNKLIIIFTAFCSNACIHGICTGPEECKCQPGFGGPTCNVSK